MSTVSYYLYRQEEKNGEQPWQSTGILSVDADGTMPRVVKSEQDTECGYTPQPQASDYLTFVPSQNSTFKFSTNSLQYSLDDGQTWTTIAANTNTPTVSAGSKILWKQNGLTPTTTDGIGTFSSSGKFVASGNPLSLVYGDNYGSITDISNVPYIFVKLFSGCTGITSAENLVLQATKLGAHCYADMFDDCTNLTKAPQLPATGTAEHCYALMFYGCTSLTEMPELPATYVANYAYWQMFYGCTSLTSTKNLVGTDVGHHAYQLMFAYCTNITTGGSISLKNALESVCSSMYQGCTSLRKIGSFDLESTASRCCMSMFNGCRSLRYTPVISTSAVSEYCFSRMFQGCSSLQEYSTFMIASNLAPNCYEYMFAGCTSLTSAPSIYAIKMKNQCCRYMFSGCTSLTEGAKISTSAESDLATECFAYMFYGCSSLNYINFNVRDMSTNSYITNWVHGVSATGTFKKNAYATWDYVGDSGVPNGWTIET